MKKIVNIFFNKFKVYKFTTDEKHCVGWEKGNLTVNFLVFFI